MDPGPRLKFSDLADVRFFIGENREDWDDTMLCGKKGIRVYTLLDTDIVELGTVVLRDVMQSVTQETVGAIILLAWNLRNPADLTKPIFPNHSPCASPDDVDFRTLSKFKCREFPKIIDTMSFPVSNSAAAASIAYVCASLLRLFSKPVDNYLSALHHIKSNFSNFYRFEFPLTWYNPPKVTLEFISNVFRRDSKFKYGMAGMLYLHNEISVATGLRRVLYEQHLSCTGMHAYTLLVRVRSAFEFPDEELFKLLDHPMTRDAVKTLAEIIRNYEGENVAENRKRMTWKYARIFDQTFFKNVQTKNCHVLVCVLAHVVKLAGVEEGTNENVLGIVRLANLSEFMKEFCRNVAQRIYEVLSTSKTARLSSGEEQ